MQMSLHAGLSNDHFSNFLAAKIKSFLDDNEA